MLHNDSGQQGPSWVSSLTDPTVGSDQVAQAFILQGLETLQGGRWHHIPRPQPHHWCREKAFPSLQPLWPCEFFSVKNSLSSPLLFFSSFSYFCGPSSSWPALVHISCSPQISVHLTPFSFCHSGEIPAPPNSKRYPAQAHRVQDLEKCIIKQKWGKGYNYDLVLS